MRLAFCILGAFSVASAIPSPHNVYNLLANRNDAEVTANCKGILTQATCCPNNKKYKKNLAHTCPQST